MYTYCRHKYTKEYIKNIGDVEVYGVFDGHEFSLQEFEATKTN